MTIRVRIAPSPTGPMHIGTARTALFNYLFAKNKGGKFILRIEDTDLERSDPKFERDIFESLAWLGIEPDEGPRVPISNFQFPISKQIPNSNSQNPKYVGRYGPYRQSERTETYRPHLEKLLKEGKAFYCFHSEKELGEEREKLLDHKRPPLHMCEYRTMPPDEAEALAETKEDHVIRFKTPAGRRIAFRDLIRGEVSFDSTLLGDFSIAKKVDVPLYNSAVVVDDELMEISHVIRGEDHISNTPKQILLIEALGFKMPRYAHLPLILGPDRSKLSKRHAVTSIGEYRKDGYLTETLFNFMALLGWAPGNDQELFSKEELTKEFSLEKVQKSGAVFDLTKLDWMNGEYIRKKSVKELTELCLPFLTDFLKFQIPNSKFQTEYIEKVVALEQPRLKKLSEIGERIDYFFREPKYDGELLRWKNMANEEIASSLDKSIKTTSNFKTPISKQEIEKTFLKEIGGGDKGRLLWPLRAALTGKRASPGPFDVMEILGVEESVRRLQLAKTKLPV